jgi:CDP-diacylglycerol--glycerol-3-phosphate 3-phosphatidyltransferase
MLSRYREPMRAWTEPIGHALVRLHLRPNHLTVAGLGVSLLAAAAFAAGRTRTGGLLILLAGLFDFFDGALARASGRVTPFGAFLDSVIDRYSDLVVLLGIVVLFAQLPHIRGVMVAMAGLLGSMMVSYTKARAESIGIECNVGVMERPERMICLIAGALLDLLEPALWVLAVLANLTAVQRIIFTRRAARDAALLSAGLAVLLMAGPARAEVPVGSEPGPAPLDTERAWASAVAAFQAGEPLPLVREFASPPAQNGPIGDYAGFLLADALARIGDVGGAQAAALVVADRYPASRLAPAALLLAATLAARVGDDDGAQTLLKRLLTAYPEGAEAPEALYLLGVIGEGLGRGGQRPPGGAHRRRRARAPALAGPAAPARRAPAARGRAQDGSGRGRAHHPGGERSEHRRSRAPNGGGSGRAAPALRGRGARHGGGRQPGARGSATGAAAPGRRAVAARGAARARPRRAWRRRGAGRRARGGRRGGSTREEHDDGQRGGDQKGTQHRAQTNRR